MSYEPGELFASTAPYYARYRAGYPLEMFQHLTACLGLDGSQTVLDLGCGTGAVAVPPARRVREVIAVDPDRQMLDEGRRIATEAGVTNIDWRLGDSHHLDDLLPPLHVVTLGQSFHWTDRRQLLSALDRHVVPGGAVVVIGGPAPDPVEPPVWADVVAEVRTRYLGPARRAGSGTYTHPEESHQDVLATSPFSRLEVARWEHTLTRDLDAVIGLQFSYSYSSPAQLGADKDAFEGDLRQALTRLHPDGVFEEHVHTQAVIATRP